MRSFLFVAFLETSTVRTRAHRCRQGMVADAHSHKGNARAGIRAFGTIPLSSTLCASKDCAIVSRRIVRHWHALKRGFEFNLLSYAVLTQE